MPKDIRSLQAMHRHDQQNPLIREMPGRHSSPREAVQAWLSPCGR
jgi:hypothetical protein